MVFFPSAIIDIMKLKNKFFRRNRFLLILVAALTLSQTAFGQSRKITGSVVSATSEPIIGASVIAAGTSSGTATDINGNFALTLPSETTAIIVSCIGYTQATVKLTGKDTYNVTLEEDANFLDEVVFVGYGTMKKKDLTGSVSSVEGDMIKKRQTTAVENALQGAIPGLTVTRSSSGPGAGTTLRVRGITSMQESSPLVIIDGVPGSLSDVQPSDIQDLTVLKDAASAAIYGSRAAAGVIVVTTRRATESEKASVDFSYTMALDVPTAMPEYGDAVGYMEAMNELAYNDTPSAGRYSVWPQEYISGYNALHKSNPDLYPDTDWAGMILKSFAPRQKYNLSVTAGTKKVKTKISLGYDNVDGLYTGDSYTWDNYAVRVNNDIELNKYMTFSIDLNGRVVDSGSPYYSPAGWMRNAGPIYAAEWSDGRPASGKDGTNPYAKMLYGGTSESRSIVSVGKIQLDIRPVTGLVISGVFSPKFYESRLKNFNKAVTYTPYDNPDGPESFLAGANTTDLTEARTSSYSYTTQLFANYNKNWGRHYLGMMAGIEEFYNNWQNISASKADYITDYFPYLSAGPDDKVTAGNSAPYENAYFSTYGRVTYNYDSKYYFQANFRADASGRFAKNYRWGYFPSVSAGWVVSREGFMKDQNVVSYLKLRASYGNLGNERIGNYPYQTTMSFTSPSVFSGGSVIGVQGVTNSKLAIEDITWETTTTYDVGMDLNFLRDRLTLNFDWYYKKTRNMLIELDIPSFMGYSAPDQNAGDMNTKGWDLSIGWNDRIGELSYGVNFNLYDYKSVMGDIGDKLTISGGTIVASGLEYKAWYGYRADGIFQNTDEVAQSAVTSATVQPGDIRFKDLSGANGVPDGIINNDYDRTVIGSSLPRMNYGGSIFLGWKGIDFNLTFQGVGKRDALLSAQMVQPLYSYWGNVPEFVAESHWSPFNTINENLSAKYPRYSQTTGTSSQNYAVSDFWLINGAYLRIKDITIGYTLPSKWLDAMNIRNLRLSCSLSDFFTICHFPKGWDPEVSSGGYPITKSVVFGASVKF